MTLISLDTNNLNARSEDRRSILLPFGHQNAVHGHIEEVIAKPFRLAQYAFLLETGTIANSLTSMVVGGNARLG
jgi:hypothetical protein